MMGPQFTASLDPDQTPTEPPPAEDTARDTEPPPVVCGFCGNPVSVPAIHTIIVSSTHGGAICNLCIIESVEIMSWQIAENKKRADSLEAANEDLMRERITIMAELEALRSPRRVHEAVEAFEHLGAAPLTDGVYEPDEEIDE